MNGRISTGALATTLARLLVSLSLALTAMASMPPAFAFASTGGETELTIQRSTDSETPSSDEKQRGDDQAHENVASSKEKGGGRSLAKTGDDTPLVPPALVAAGAGLSILGIATRM